MKYLLLLPILLTSLNRSYAGDCYAATICPDGSPIACEVWNSGYDICTFFVIQNQQVRCSGINAFGMWENISLSCMPLCCSIQ